MNFTGFYGNGPIKTALNAHLFHAYLIEGPEGSGKHTLADLITNALVCDGEEPPCGVCRQCYKVKHRCHPDIIDIPADLPVEELRQILSGIVLTPNDARHKVYRIDRAEKMNDSCMNLLLKTLEEPPSYAVFLLLCNAKEGVLPTVRSRCQVLSLAPLPEEIVREHFLKTEGNYGDEARGAYLLSAGFLGKALALYKAGETKDAALCKTLENALFSGDIPAVLTLFRFATREELLSFYNAFSLYIKGRLRNCKDEKKARFYVRLVRSWNDAAPAMSTNINVKFWNTNLARLCLKARG